MTGRTGRTNLLDSSEALLYSAPFKEPYVTSAGSIDAREILLVRLRSRGEEGVGEAAPLSLRGGADPSAVLRSARAGLAELGADLELTELSDVEAGLALLDTDTDPTARAAIEMALLDLCARLRDIPVWSLLGASSPTPIECNATLPMAEPERLSSLAAEYAAEGFSEFKLKVGSPRDIEMAEAVIAGAGKDAVIRLDANGTWSPDEAVGALSELDHACPHLSLVEQPVRQPEGLARVKARTSLPVAADESLVTIDDARDLIRLGACDLGTAKLSKVGGAINAIAIAEEIPIYYSSALEGPLGIAGAAHAAFASSDSGFRHGLASDHLFADSIATSSLREGALIQPPTRPGLGVSIDEDALARLRSDPERTSRVI